LKSIDNIQFKLNRFAKGYVFTYADFSTEVKSKEAIIKALNRMVVNGKLQKLAKGKYYKPEETIFGTLAPNEYQTVKDLLECDGKPIGYLTGLSMYATLGLSTQISNTIQIGRNDARPQLKRDQYIIKFIVQKNSITKENIKALQYLDAIRFIKKIPDTTNAQVCTRLLAILKKINAIDLTTLINLSKNYPASTRALLGALLEALGNTKHTAILRATLNPITSYQLTGLEKTLPNAISWNIK
jgi:Family of unknown function (DUF6088)